MLMTMIQQVEYARRQQHSHYSVIAPPADHIRPEYRAGSGAREDASDS